MTQYIIYFNQTHIFDFDNNIPTLLDIKEKLTETEDNIPIELINITYNQKDINTDHDLEFIYYNEINNINYNSIIILRANIKQSLKGGKGGFGAQLRALAKQKAAKQTLDFGSCRDLQGKYIIIKL